MKIQNYALGNWITGEGEGQALIDGANGDIIGYATSKGLDWADMLEYGRKTGGHTLRKMTFQQRGRMIKSLALYLHEKRKSYYRD